MLINTNLCHISLEVCLFSVKLMQRALCISIFLGICMMNYATKVFLGEYIESLKGKNFSYVVLILNYILCIKFFSHIVSNVMRYFSTCSLLCNLPASLAAALPGPLQNRQSQPQLMTIDCLPQKSLGFVSPLPSSGFFI